MLSGPLGGRGMGREEWEGLLCRETERDGRTSSWKQNAETFISIVIHIWPSIPFCFSLKICQDNTAVTTPNTVMVATHSATKEAVVAVKTPVPEEGETQTSMTHAV